MDSLRRDVTETRDSLKRLDSHVEELARDVSVLSTDVRTLLRALHAVLHPDDDRSRPSTSSSCKPRQSRHGRSKTPTKSSRSEPSSSTSSRPPALFPSSLLTSSGPPTTSGNPEQSSSASSRPSTSSATQKKRGSLVDASPEHVDSRLRQRLHDDAIRTSCPPKDASQAPAAVPPPGQRLSRGGSGSSSRDSVMADEVDTETAAGEQTYVFTDSGPPSASRRMAGEWQPGVPVTATETGGPIRSRSRTVAPMQVDNSMGGDSSTPTTGMSSSNSHASVLLTTDL